MRSLKRSTALVALSMAAVLVLPAGSGSAQIPVPLPTSRPTQDPTPTPTPTPTRRPTPRPSTSPDPSPTPSSTPRPKRPAHEPSPAERRGIAAWLTRERTPARTTTRLLELLDRTKPGKAPLTPAEAREGFGRFPVVGYVWYQDDYGAPRYSGHYEFHAGTDLFAVAGTPVISVVDGTIVNLGSFSRGGNAIWLQGDDGVRYYYGHLRAYRTDLAIGARVEQGELVGWVGATGQARGYPHVHFEINPGGLGTVNPKPILDAWLDDAEAGAVSAIANLARVAELAPYGAARWDSLFAMIGEHAPAQPALWTAGWDGSGTLAGLDLVLADLAASSDVVGFVEGGGRWLGFDDVLAAIALDGGH